MEKLLGNYRAQVVDNKDPEKYGKVLLWIPDIMPLVDKTKGIWARPANNPIGGRNLEADEQNYYAGSSYIPPKGSWVFCFFESGNINRPYYFGALDLENTKVLPENQKGTNYEKKWTVLKTHSGRCVIVSDDEYDERTEITGKKRQISTPPTGDLNSVYTIDDNQTTILFDERSGKEKILIRTYKGDFFHIDVDEQQLQTYFKSDILIKTDGSFKVTAKESVDVKSTTGNVNIEAQSENINIKSGGKINTQSGSDMNIRSGATQNLQSNANMNMLAGGNINSDGAMIMDQSGAANGAGSASNASTSDPEGERDS